MILIHPPVAKPCEPPAGIAKLSGALKHHGISHVLLDANLEALNYSFGRSNGLSIPRPDRWTRRAFRNMSNNYSLLRTWQTYRNIDRYKRAVIDLNHAIEHSFPGGARPGLANYQHDDYSPLRSADLIKAAEYPEMNPYYPYFSKRLSLLLKRSDVSPIGFSLNYLSQALCTFAMIGYIRQHVPNVKIIIGGGLVTSWMKNTLWKEPFAGLVDLCVSGPGEGPVLSLNGVAASEETHCTPAYGSLPFNGYLSPGPILPYSASNGCYWNKCSFCPEQAEDNPYIPLPVHRVTDDLHSLITETDPALVHLLDNAVSPALLKELALHPLGVPWYGFARVSTLLTDRDFCIALKNSGCVMLKLGLESGDQEVLDALQKGISVETAAIALRTLKNAGIATYVYLLFGTPPETMAEARNTLEFVVHNRENIDFLNLALFNMPVCGTDNSIYERRSFYEGDLSLYTDFRHPRDWSRKDVRNFLDNEFRKHQAVSEILKNDPPVFTSNHAPFFMLSGKS